MYSIALIQNQSEMAHYGYADARPMLKELGYSVELYTADNIEQLSFAFDRNLFDAVIFASNALNDKTILSEVNSSNFTSSFRNWLTSGRGKGCLVLLQLKLASSNVPNLQFLPCPIDLVEAKVRPNEEASATGALQFTKVNTDSSFMSYPHFISSIELQQSALNFKSLPGLYWHYWSNVNLSDWEEHIVDDSFEPNVRPLLLSSRNTSTGRVVVSALPIDWQKQRNLFDNIITYVVEGEHKTAFIVDQDNNNIALGYLIGTLKSQRFPFRCYYVNQDLSEFETNLKNGVHESLIFGPQVSLGHLNSKISEVVQNLVQCGDLKIMAIDEDDDFRRKFSIAGRERTAKKLLSDLEMQVQSELKSGYIDGSFWSTAETLQVLEELEASASYSLYVDEVLRLADLHDKNGSYDEVFGASCAFMWLRANYLGLENSKTRESISWLRSKISAYDTREQAQAYLIFSRLEVISDEEIERLKILLMNLSTDSMSEIDCIVFLKCCLATKSFNSIQTLLARLEDKQSKDSGAWLDLATTSDAVSTLVALSNALRIGESNLYAKLKQRIEEMIFKGIIHVQDSLERTSGNNKSSDYPWDGKASTAIKCINAWLLTEELIDFPVQELVDSLRKFENRAIKISSNRKALNVLKELKDENNNLKKESQTLNENINEYAKKLFRTRIQAVIIFLLFYFSLSIGLGILNKYDIDGLLSILKIGFVDNWGTHLAAFAVIAAMLSVPWKKVLRRNYENS